LIQPSSGAAERAFSILLSVQGDNQSQMLHEYLEASMMLRCNRRKNSNINTAIKPRKFGGNFLIFEGKKKKLGKFLSSSEKIIHMPKVNQSTIQCPAHTQKLNPK
jgi:hypothetical protein